jgi:outer membrane receptor protein involved in Fe transport
VKEVFGELRVPLVEGRRFVHELSLDAGARYADYSSAGGVTAYKLGASWAPSETLRLRAMFQRAVRAPNIFELGEPVRFTFVEVAGDPCAAFYETTGSTTISAPLRDLCVATGAPAAAFTLLPSGDYDTAVPDALEGFIANGFTGGNPALREEQADTITAGLVYQPAWLEDSSLQLDWYRIELRDAIDSLSAFDILPGCYDPAHNPAGDPNHLMCRLVTRDSVTGGLFGGAGTGVSEIAQNISKREVEGIDLQLRTTRDVGRFGELELSLISSLLMRNDRRPAATFPLAHCKGKYGNCNGPNPSVRFAQRTTWTLNDWSASYRWRFIRATELRPGFGCVDPFCSISDTHYVDLTFEWAPSDLRWLAGFRLTLELENLFDEDPPLVGDTAAESTSGNTLPGLYDPLGRRITLSFTKLFGAP